MVEREVESSTWPRWAAARYSGMKPRRISSSTARSCVCVSVKFRCFAINPRPANPGRDRRVHQASLCHTCRSRNPNAVSHSRSRFEGSAIEDIDQSSAARRVKNSARIIARSFSVSDSAG